MSELDHFQFCRLSRVFNLSADLLDETDYRINEWLKEQIAAAEKRLENARKNLEAKIAEQDLARGRPLTSAEKVANLKKALEAEYAKEPRSCL